MKWIMINTVAIICAVTAGMLCFHGKPDWGWFLVVAVITAVYPSKA